MCWFHEQHCAVASVGVTSCIWFARWPTSLRRGGLRTEPTPRPSAIRRRGRRQPEAGGLGMPCDVFGIYQLALLPLGEADASRGPSWHDVKLPAGATSSIKIALWPVPVPHAAFVCAVAGRA